MDIFGKLCPPAGKMIDHSTFQELFDQVVKAGFEDVALTVIGKGHPSDNEQATLTINSATFDNDASFILATALNQLYPDIKFSIESSGEEVACLKNGAGVAIRKVIDIRNERIASMLDNAARRVQEEAYERLNPSQHTAQDVDDEPWRNIYDANGLITDRIMAD